MCNARRSGALLAFGAFEGLEPAFAPTPTTPDPQTTREALHAPGANDWMAAMNVAIVDNMWRLNVFKEVPRPNGKNTITLKWGFRRKYENGSLTKHKARLLVRGFTQVFGVDYREAHFYAPVVRLESFRVLISIAALFDLDLRQIGVSATYLPGYIDREAYMEPPLTYEWEGTVGSSKRDPTSQGRPAESGTRSLKPAWRNSYSCSIRGTTPYSASAIGDAATWAVCAFWVDDETGGGSRQQLDRVASILSQKYGISGEGEIRWTLGTGVARDRNTHTILLSQEEYINNLISRFELQNATTVTTPLEPGAILTKDQCPTKPAEQTCPATGTGNYSAPRSLSHPLHG